MIEGEQWFTVCSKLSKIELVRVTCFAQIQVNCYQDIFRKMQSMGFEPMRVATLELESSALDRSATIALKRPTF